MCKKLLSLREIQKIELDILSYVDSLCVKENIKYSLDGGTLIGAIRHKGFIPWDDDIDIFMLREDYNRFVEVMQGASFPYRLLSPGKSEQYYIPFCKVVDTRTELIEYNAVPMKDMGVYIDVFPIDKLPVNESERRKLQKKCWKLRKVMGRARLWIKGNNQRGGLYKILCWGCYLYGWKRAFKHFDQLCQSYKGIETELYSDIPESPTLDYCLPKRIFDETFRVAFENREFSAIKGYDEYLTLTYGNYMELPPRNQRVRKHSFDAYWK